MEANAASLVAQDFQGRLNAEGFTEGVDKLTFRVNRPGFYLITSFMEVTTQEVTAGVHTLQAKVAYVTYDGTTFNAQVLNPGGTIDLEAAVGTVAWGSGIVHTVGPGTITVSLVSTDSGAVTTPGRLSAYIRITPLQFF